MTADPLLRAWLDGQEGVPDEMRALLAGALGLGGPVIEGTATEVSPPAPASAARASGSTGITTCGTAPSNTVIFPSSRTTR